VRVEEEGLRLAEELSEDRLLVALETLELAEKAIDAAALLQATRLMLAHLLFMRASRQAS
jgi:hypothetical protein